VTCNNLGALHRHRGEVAEAERCYRRALSIKLALLGPEHPDVATTHHNLGVLHSGAANTEPARAAFARAHATFETAFGPDHPHTRASREELANLELRGGQQD
jgi:Tfp pilus assembly protein PilF